MIRNKNFFSVDRELSHVHVNIFFSRVQGTGDWYRSLMIGDRKLKTYKIFFFVGFMNSPIKKIDFV